MTTDSRRRLTKDRAVAIKGKPITYLGKMSELKNNKEEELIDARGKVIMPRLVNCYNHMTHH